MLAPEPCQGCGGSDCFDLTEDLNLYDLQGDPFLPVVNCPPGFNCNPDPAGGVIQLLCCNDVLSASYPPNATTAQYDAAISQLTQECAARLPFCGQPPTTPGQTITFYFNAPQSCTVPCPNGAPPFTYIVPAGVVLGFSQASANASAKALACALAVKNRFCIPLTVDAYWTLDEAAAGPNPVPRIDSVHSLALNDVSFGGQPGVPALFSLGLPRIWNSYNGDFDTHGTNFLSYGGSAGFSLFGWVKIIAGCNDGSFGPRMFLSNNSSADEIVVEFGNTFGGQSNVFISWTTDTDSGQSNTPGISIGSWHFFHAFYDATLQKVGISLDNGANTYTGTNVIFPSWPTGEFQIFGSTGTNLNLIFDEIGIKMSRMLTSAEVTSLYNGGSGKTWPLT